jgi:hypothetical protein
VVASQAVASDAERIDEAVGAPWPRDYTLVNLHHHDSAADQDFEPLSFGKALAAVLKAKRKGEKEEGWQPAPSSLVPVPTSAPSPTPATSSTAAPTAAPITAAPTAAPTTAPTAAPTAAPAKPRKAMPHSCVEAGDGCCTTPEGRPFCAGMNLICIDGKRCQVEEGLANHVPGGFLDDELCPGHPNVLRQSQACSALTLG